MTSPRRAYALTLALPFITALIAPQLASAQNSAPPPTPFVNMIPVSRDIPYPGTIKLDVDASDSARSLFKVRETIPVAGPGPMTLMVSKWLPGAHGPRGEIDKIAGIEFWANGAKLPWRRDPVEVYGFHIDVPAGVSAIEARFVYLSALQANQGRIVSTPEMANVQWTLVSMYPAGYATNRIPVVASLTLPAGWQAATALRPTATATSGPNTITYGEINYEDLIDSPVIAGRYFRKDDIGHGVTLNSIADSQKELDIPADVLGKHRAMVDQAIKLFGARHYDHYDILNAVSDKLGGIGLEHHRSTEISTDPGYYINYDDALLDRNVFPHEFVHSWDGKFRRPEGHIVADFHTPLRNELMWVYEGQTQFWGNVLEARSGMSSKQDVLDKIAIAAAGLDNLKGREWRPLVDTTYDPIVQNRRPEPWGSYMRSEDYYNEGMLIWTEADAIIRQGTANKRGIDDFAKAFFGVNDGDWGELPYSRAEVIRILNQVYAYDWAGFLHQRIDLTSTRAPLAGFTRSGYELQYSDKPTKAYKLARMSNGGTDFNYSLGFGVSKDKKVTGVRWGSPAFDAAVRTGDELVAVGGKAYSNEALSDAVKAAKGGSTPVRVTVKRGDVVQVISIPYYDGLRYPRLVKTGTGDGPLDRLLAPR